LYLFVVGVLFFFALISGEICKAAGQGRNSGTAHCYKRLVLQFAVPFGAKAGVMTDMVCRTDYCIGPTHHFGQFCSFVFPAAIMMDKSATRSLHHLPVVTNKRVLAADIEHTATTEIQMGACCAPARPAGCIGGCLTVDDLFHVSGFVLFCPKMVLVLKKLNKTNFSLPVPCPETGGNNKIRLA